MVRTTSGRSQLRSSSIFVWPFLVLFLPRRFLQSSLWLILGGALICRVILVTLGISPFYFTLARVDGLAAGALLAVVQFRGALASFRRPFLFVAGISGAMTFAEGVLAHHSGAAWIQVSKFSFVTAFYASLIGLLLTTSLSGATRWLRSAPLRFVGRISYGLYVFHPMVYAFLFPRLASETASVRAATGITATFVLALLSWYSFERHFIRLKDRLAPERARFPARAHSMSAP